MTTAAPKSHLTAGIVAALVGALLGAVAWAVVASLTNYKIGFAAVGVGALAGLLAGRTGGGHPALPPAAAMIGVLACLVGDLLIDAHDLSEALKQLGSDVSMLTVLKEAVKDPAGFGWELYKEGFQALDVLFYGIAAVVAFRLAEQHGSPAASAPGFAPATPSDAPPVPASDAPTWAPPATDAVPGAAPAPPADPPPATDAPGPEQPR
jgi:hypothetical protein